MTTIQALIITLLIVSMCFLIEKVCTIFLKIQVGNEKFNENNCDTCSIEKFNEDNKKTDAPKCRVVCDDEKENNDNKKSDDEKKTENFGQIGNVTQIIKDNLGINNETVNTDSAQNKQGTQDTQTQNDAQDSQIKVDIQDDSYGVPAFSVSEGIQKAQQIESNILDTLDPSKAQHVRNITDGMRDDMHYGERGGKFYWLNRSGATAYDDRYGHGGMFYDEHPAYNRFRHTELKTDNLHNTGGRYGQSQEEYDYDQNAYSKSYQILAEETEKRADTTTDFKGPYQKVWPKSQKLRTTFNRRRIEGTLDDEIPYTDYNHLPVAAGYKSHDYEYGYSYLPPEKWYPQPPRPPICVTERRSPVCPVYANGTNVDLKEWNSARRITPPDLINVDYINDKLNAGR